MGWTTVAQTCVLRRMRSSARTSGPPAATRPHSRACGGIDTGAAGTLPPRSEVGCAGWVLSPTRCRQPWLRNTAENGRVFRGESYRHHRDCIVVEAVLRRPLVLGQRAEHPVVE